MKIHWVIRNQSSGSGEAAAWSWRLRDSKGHWLVAPESGTLQEFTIACTARPAIVILLLPASRVSSHEVSFLTRERRHLNRIIPYMLEEQFAVSPDQLHFAFAKPGRERVAVAVTDKLWFAQLLQEVESTGIEINLAVSEALALQLYPRGWTILLEQDKALVHYQAGLGFGVDPALLEPALRALAAQRLLPEGVLLVAEQELDTALRNSLTGLIKSIDSGLPVHFKTLDFWDVLAADFGGLPDLRQGQFARKLPLARYWQQLRVAAMTFSLAAIAWVIVSVLQLQQFNARQAELQAAITAAYRDVMPEGELVNPTLQLRNQLNRMSGAIGGMSVLTLLSEVSAVLETADQVQLRRVTFNEQSQDLQLVLGANSNSSIVQLIDEINQSGLNAVAQTMNQSGNEQQATVLITRGRQ